MDNVDEELVQENLQSTETLPPPNDGDIDTRTLDTSMTRLDTDTTTLDTNTSTNECASGGDKLKISEECFDDICEDTSGVFEDNLYKKIEDDLLQSVRVNPIVMLNSSMNDRSICQTGLPDIRVMFNSSNLSLAQGKEDWRAQTEKNREQQKLRLSEYDLSVGLRGSGLSYLNKFGGGGQEEELFKLM